MSTETIIWIAYGVSVLVAWIPCTIVFFMENDSDAENGAMGLTFSAVWPAVVVIYIGYRISKYIGNRIRRHVA